MKTIHAKQGDVVRFPNGIELNYDAVNEAVVVLTTLKKRHLTLVPALLKGEQQEWLHLSQGVWMIGSGT